MGGGTPHIPIEGIWSDIQSSVRGDTAQNSKMLEKQGGGTPHIPVEGKK